MSLVVAEGLALRGRLQPTSLTLAAGSLTCLVGPNGSGKTSLLLALAGVGRPAGVVRIAGEAPNHLSPAQRQRLYAFLPASRDIIWPLKVRDLIALGLPAETDHGAIEPLLATFGLEALADQRIDRVSTGERSRAMIARALAAEPRLLLLDEPIANLDPLWQIRLMEHIAAYVRTGERAALVAMHDLDAAAVYAQRLLIMQHGAIAADGPAQTLIEGPEIAAIFGVTRRHGRWRPVASG